MTDIFVCRAHLQRGRRVPVRLPRVQRDLCQACRARAPSHSGIRETHGTCGTECRRFSAPVSSSPNAEAAQNVLDQDISIARPVREDLSKPMQDRVLPLDVRQGIWERHFIDCEMQEGPEPLQLQIPRNKRNTLLVGDKIVDGEK